MNLFSLDLGLGFGFGIGLGLGKRVQGKWGWGWGLKIYPWTGMEMKIIPANRGGPGMDGVFLSGYGDCETPRKSNFLKNGKIVISVKIQKISRSRMTKRTSPLESSREI